jgi:class 3 adenylate cyclase
MPGASIESHTVSHSVDAVIVAPPMRSYREMLADHLGRRIGASVVFADVEKSGELKRSIGLDAWNDLAKRLRSIATDILDVRAGHLVNTAGDSLLLAFSSSSEAARFAVRYQERLRQLNAEPNRAWNLSMRFGVHQGDVMVDEAEEGRLDIKGLAVDRAQRIQEQATGGRILVSVEIERAVVGDGTPWSSGVHWLPLGQVELRGQEGLPVELFELRPPTGDGPEVAEAAQHQRKTSLPSDPGFVGRAVTVPWESGHRQGVIVRAVGPPGSPRVEVQLIHKGEAIILPFPLDAVTFY